MEMDPKQAEVLVRARDEGRIQLALRNPLEKNQPKAKPVSKPKRIARYTPPSRITVIRGTDVSVVKR
jgi:pilus assembly protein CpaB